MLRSNSKKVIEKVRSYIIKGVDHEYFGLEADPDFNTACKLILSACKNEETWTVFVGSRYADRRSGVRGCRDHERSGLDDFRDWAKGLSLAFNTCYYYNVSAVDLLADWLEESESEKAKYSESEAEEMITRLIYRELTKGAAKA